jgi:hypothetical protein
MLNMMPPLVGLLAMITLLAGSLFRSRDLKRMGILLVVAVPLLIIPVIYTGRAAVVTVGNFPGVSLEVIGAHQESVQLTWIATTIGGLVALAGFVVFLRRVPPAWFIATVLALALIGEAMMLRTAHLGGQIRHPESRLVSAPNRLQVIVRRVGAAV